MKQILLITFCVIVNICVLIDVYTVHKRAY